MSLRDRQLLDIAALSGADAARLFRRRRQAISQGVKEDSRHYFSAQDVALILNDAHRRDLERIEQLIRFIEANYKPEVRVAAKRDAPETDKITAIFPHRNGEQRAPDFEDKADPAVDVRDQILPHRYVHQQLLNVARKADRVVLVFNDNQEHLSPNATFMTVLMSLLSMRLQAELNLILPDTQMVNYINVRMSAVVKQVITIRKVAAVPFLVAQRHNAFRGFIFGRFSITEAHPSDAEALWWQANFGLDRTNQFRGRALID